MADLFSVTAPLSIRFADGDKAIMVERLAHHGGLLFLTPFWTEKAVEQVLWYVGGPITGEGPWKVGQAVVQVLGCHGTDPVLATEFAQWQSYLEQLGDGYPARDRVLKFMRGNAPRARVIDAER
jgi:hypothetical protein